MAFWFTGKSTEEDIITQGELLPCELHFLIYCFEKYNIPLDLSLEWGWDLATKVLSCFFNLFAGPAGMTDISRGLLLLGIFLWRIVVISMFRLPVGKSGYCDDYTIPASKADILSLCHWLRLRLNYASGYNKWFFAYSQGSSFKLWLLLDIVLIWNMQVPESRLCWKKNVATAVLSNFWTIPPVLVALVSCIDMLLLFSLLFRLAINTLANNSIFLFLQEASAF